MRIKMYGASDIGRVRKTNQDSLFFDAEKGLAIVADGIGGRKGGEIASGITVTTISEAYHKMSRIDSHSVPPFLLETIDVTNQKIIAKGEMNEEYLGMGTTLNALVFTSETLYLAHVGDSRTYLYHKGGLWQLTLDHNMEVYVERGWLPRETLLRSGKPAALVRALGLAPKCEIDIYQRSLKVGDIFLTCSDGLTGMVVDKKIRNIIRENEGKLSTLPQKLIEEANKNGGRDNTTIVISEVMRS